mmetsp:Transcript_70804/g.118393  ORF Transcript_70804/g.118393 Transcript_70804/m.118393 type:complete len:325 (+) Transcript_70804:2107-3081(+)
MDERRLPGGGRGGDAQGLHEGPRVAVHATRRAVVPAVVVQALPRRHMLHGQVHGVHADGAGDVADLATRPAAAAGRSAGAVAPGRAAAHEAICVLGAPFSAHRATPAAAAHAHAGAADAEVTEAVASAHRPGGIRAVVLALVPVVAVRAVLAALRRVPSGAVALAGPGIRPGDDARPVSGADGTARAVQSSAGACDVAAQASPTVIARAAAATEVQQVPAGVVQVDVAPAMAVAEVGRSVRRDAWARVLAGNAGVAGLAHAHRQPGEVHGVLGGRGLLALPVARAGHLFGRTDRDLDGALQLAVLPSVPENAGGGSVADTSPGP